MTQAAIYFAIRVTTVIGFARQGYCTEALEWLDKAWRNEFAPPITELTDDELCRALELARATEEALFQLITYRVKEQLT